MRILAFILSFIVFVMVALPCTDSIFSCIDENVSTEIHKPHQEHSHNIHDECTPLCTCNCCGTSITLPVLISFLKNDIKNYNTCRFIYTYHYHYKFAKGLWHPPNIG
ncbi:DUF6660 family protein [Wenyingzhuangia sp. IMCC45467]